MPIGLRQVSRTQGQKKLTGTFDPLDLVNGQEAAETDEAWHKADDKKDEQRDSRDKTEASISHTGPFFSGSEIEIHQFPC